MSAFAPMFERNRYLSFLNVTGNVEDAIATLRGIEASDEEIAALFSDANWRPNLVGVVALLMRDRVSQPLIDALWAAFDRPSWVSPQVAVTASQIDPGFVAHAEARIATAPLKGRAALLALLGRPADIDPQDHGDRIALEWRERIREQLTKSLN